MADVPAHEPNERSTGRFVSVVIAASVLTGCNANQAINPSGQAGRCANDLACDPYNPISYAQNNTGNAGVAANRRRSGRSRSLNGMRTPRPSKRGWPGSPRRAPRLPEAAPWGG
jgi:hypothetical protein